MRCWKSKNWVISILLTKQSYKQISVTNEFSKATIPLKDLKRGVTREEWEVIALVCSPEEPNSQSN